MPFDIKINPTSCEILVGDGGGGESLKFNAKTEKDSLKALFYHVKGKEKEEVTNQYESLEGFLARRLIA